MVLVLSECANDVFTIYPALNFYEVLELETPCIALRVSVQNFTGLVASRTTLLPHRNTAARINAHTYMPF